MPRKESTARKGRRGKFLLQARKEMKGQRGEEGKDSEERIVRKGWRGEEREDGEARKERTSMKGWRGNEELPYKKVG